MAKKWRNKSNTLEISGFEELYEKFAKAGKDASVEGRKLFEKCAENLYDELYYKGKSAGLQEHLLEQIEEDLIERENVWRASVGWKKPRPKNPLPDTYKVMFYNYGTPSGDRITKAGANRGQETPHPKGSHGFIKKAKLAAAQKNKKLQKETLKRILGDLER